ncbi:C4-dicarboxylate transporter DcuC [Escherichia coli]|uniref:C4-dicarboxylate transporter DcuC n=1 Tax=Escherichia coli TaxID=562 RepID=A0A376YBI8_ECOLX|nr:C4-dicarboxylate transporter DcuC [Escherichia coli]
MSVKSLPLPLRFMPFLPFTPIIGVLIFDGKWGPQLHIITILVICMLIASHSGVPPQL